MRKRDWVRVHHEKKSDGVRVHHEKRSDMLRLYHERKSDGVGVVKLVLQFVAHMVGLVSLDELGRCNLNE